MATCMFSASYLNISAQRVAETEFKTSRPHAARVLVHGAAGAALRTSKIIKS
jgi:hypothetical protein